MNSFNEEQLMCILSTLISNLVEVIQVINSFSATILPVINQYLESLKRLEEATLERNRSLRRYLRHCEKYSLRQPRTNWINPGRADSFWDNLINDRTVASEWRKNFRMDKETFKKLSTLLEPSLKPNENAFRRDCLTVEKKVGMCLYYLKDQGGYRMTANTFGVAVPTLSAVLPQFCDAVINISQQYIQLPKTNEATEAIIDRFYNKFGFPQVFGCIDGTHIPIKCPSEHGHEYFCYKMKYSINVQAICDEKGLFLDVDVSWPGSTHDGKVFKNSFVNKQFAAKTFPGKKKRLSKKHGYVPPLLIGDPAYPLLPNIMKEYSTCTSNEEVLFNEMLRSTRNQIECAFGRLKARWRILLRPIDVDISLVPKIIYTCFILHNFCEMNKIPLGDECLQRVICKDKQDQNCSHHTSEDVIYSYNTAEGEKVRNALTTFFSSQ